MTQAAGAAAPPSAAPGAATPGRTRPRRLRVTLNDDGERHPTENALSVFTLLAGLVSCVLGFLADKAGAGTWAGATASWLGLIALAVGLPAQLFSATRTERMLIVTGLVAAFVGGALGLAHGGLFP